MDKIIKCSSCKYEGKEEIFLMKLLSAMYISKTDSIQSFTQIKCPKCSNLITIIYETLDCLTIEE